MNKPLLFIVLFLTGPLFGNPWQELLQQHKPLMGEYAFALISKQLEAFQAGEAPAIADARIKKIPIIECHEPLIDLQVTYHPRMSVMQGEELVKAHTYIEDIDPRSDKHTMMRKGVYDALVRMLQELDVLAPQFGYAVGDLEIKLFEGLRDLATQKELFDTKLTALQAANPHMSYEKAYAETTKWVSPYINNVPVHSTGAAVDIHLYNKKTHNFCDMGRFNTGGKLAPMLTNFPLSPEQINNRLLFLIAATRAGLTSYVYEFWHFSYGDRYAAYWQENTDHAQYGGL